MKNIKLIINHETKLKQILNIIKEFKYKFLNGCYVINDKEYKQFKKKIVTSDIMVTIFRNPDYVIIKEKMSKPTPPNKYVTQKEFKNFKNYVYEKFEQIDERFEQIDQRFEQIDRRFEQIDERFKQIDEKFERIDERFEQIDRKIDIVTFQIQKLIDAATQKNN